MNWNSFTLVAVHFMSDFQTLIFNYIACDFYLIRIRGGKRTTTMACKTRVMQLMEASKLMLIASFISGLIMSS